MEIPSFASRIGCVTNPSLNSNFHRRTTSTGIHRKTCWTYSYLLTLYMQLWNPREEIYHPNTTSPLVLLGCCFEVAESTQIFKWSWSNWEMISVAVGDRLSDLSQYEFRVYISSYTYSLGYLYWRGLISQCVLQLFNSKFDEVG